MTPANVGRSILSAAKRKSPELLAIAGVVGVVGTVVLAIRATLKTPKVIDDFKDEIEEVRDRKIDAEGYTDADKRKDITGVYVRTGMKLVKIYATTAAVAVLTVMAFLTSNGQLKKRNLELGATCTTLYNAFNSYRERVRKKFGDEVENDIYLGIEEQEVEETIVDKNGKEKTQKVKKSVVTGQGNGFGKLFTRSNMYWQNDKTYFQNWLTMMQSHLNDKMKCHRIGDYCTLGLNEAYHMLGFNEEVDAMPMGWIFDLRNPFGDNKIELTATPTHVPNEYTGELEDAYYIDFNIDGNVEDELRRRKLDLKRIA